MKLYNFYSTEILVIGLKPILHYLLQNEALFFFSSRISFNLILNVLYLAHHSICSKVFRILYDT